MKESIALEKVLLQHLACSSDRLNFIALFVMELIRVKTVNFVQIATGLNAAAKKESNYRRIQKFFKNFFSDAMLRNLVLGQLHTKKPRVLCLDRANWRFRSLKVNIMAIGLAHKGTAFGLLWSMLPKFANSNQGERISLVRRLLKLIPAEEIHTLVADREFLGPDWFAFLVKENINFHIRIRRNLIIEHDGMPLYIYGLFANLPVGQALTLRNKHLICGQYLSVTGMKLADGDYLILVTNANPKDSLSLYKQPCFLEIFFKAIKKTGFDFEQTPLRNLDRISTLLALVSIAFVWAHLLGEHLHDTIIAFPQSTTHRRLAVKYNVKPLQQELVNPCQIT